MKTRGQSTIIIPKDPVQLEQGAYRMLDESVAAILKDSDFKKAFLK
jgi:hypothetical protein